MVHIIVNHRAMLLSPFDEVICMYSLLKAILFKLHKITINNNTFISLLISIK